MTIKVLLDDPAEFYNIVFDDTITVQQVHLLTDEVVLVEYTLPDDYAEGNDFGNAVLASFVAAYGRLQLYGLLAELGPRALYFDTDSVIYREGEGDAPLPMGDYMGDLVSEIPAGLRMVEFCSGGPKNYAFLLEDEKTGARTAHLKVKGFTLNHAAGEVLGFNDMKGLVKNYVQYHTDNDRVNIPTVQFKRTIDYHIITNKFDKQYGVVYDKRVVQPDYSTLPYGYREIETYPASESSDRESESDGASFSP